MMELKGGGIMTLKPPKRTGILIQQALPIFLQQLLAILVGVISTMIVGRLGKDELTAASMSNTVVQWLQCVYTGISTGSTIVVARLWGAGNKESTRNIFLSSVYANLALSLLILSVAVLFQEQILHLLFAGATESVMANMRIYFRLVMISMPAMAVSGVIGACMRGIGDNKGMLYISILMNILNLTLSYAFIWGFAPLKIPAMGIYGAGIATCFARYVSLGVYLVYLCIYGKEILPGSLKIHLREGMFGKVLKIGVPSGIEHFLWNSGFVILQSMLIGFGTAFQAGYQIGSNFNGLLTVPSTTMEIALAAIVGQILGRGDTKAAKETVRAARYLYVVIFSVIVTLGLLLAKPIAGLYTTDPETLPEAVYFIRIFTIFAVAIGYSGNMIGFLRGAGETKYLLISNATGLWAGRLLVTWILLHWLDPHIALAAGLCADFFGRAISNHIRVQQGKWLTKKL